MPAGAKKRHLQQRSENTTVILEVGVLMISACGLIGLSLVRTFDLLDVVSYIDSFILSYIQIVLALLGMLSGLGLMHKGLSLSRQLKHARRSIADFRNLADVRETFIGMAEHRLRTPISGVRWAIGSIQESPRLTDEEQDLLAKAKQKIQKANDLLEKLLRLQHFELYDFQLSEKKDVCDLGELIKSILDDLSYLIEENGVTVNFDNSLKVTVPCDIYLLKSSLTNILDNAIRYSPKGKVHIMLKPAKEGVKLIVEDNGIGMNPIELDHVFERFYRGENAQRIAPHETGLGMYLTKQIIGLHGGTIDVSSVEDRGTTITIILPQQ